MDKPQTVRLTTKVPELEGMEDRSPCLFIFPMELTIQDRGTTIL